MCENHLLISEVRSRGSKFIFQKDILRWFIFVLIGILTALIAALIDITAEELCEFKFRSIKESILY